MKPLKLKLKYFGPFNYETEEIDFEKLSTNGLFLITGKTGSGKSMIFDAISFALFGETSGGERANDKLKSDFADPKSVCSVCFTFSHNGDTYEVTRDPKQPYNNNLHPRTPQATLVKNGKVMVTGTSDVTEKIKNLLGINVTQFRQICMLSQGKFKDFLVSKTKEKTEILGSILNTSKYGKYSEVLGKKATEVKNRTRANKNSIIQHLQDVDVDADCPDKDLFDIYVSAMAGVENTWNIEETMEALDRIIIYDEGLSEKYDREHLTANTGYLAENNKLVLAQTDNANIQELDKLKKEKVKLESEQTDVSNKMAKLEKKKRASHEIRPKYNICNETEGKCKRLEQDITENNDKLQAAKAVLEEKEKQFKAASQKASMIDDYKVKINKITEDEEKYEKRDRSVQHIKELADRKETLKTKQEDLKEKKKKLENSQKENNDIVIQLDGADLKLEKEKQNNIIIANLIHECNAVKTIDVKGFEQVKKDLKNAQDAYLKADEEYKEALNEKEDKVRRYELNRAGIMAGHLIDGEKCPVCGSVHHPEPAKLTSDTVTEEDVKLAEEGLRVKEDVKNNANAGAASAKRGMEEKEKTLKRKIFDILNNAFFGTTAEDSDYETLLSLLEDKGSVLNNALAASNSELRSLEDDCTMYKNAKEAIEKLAEEIKLNSEALDSANNQFAACDREHATAEAEFKGYAVLEYENLEKAREARADLEAEAKKLSDSIETYRLAVEEAKTRVAKISSTIETLNESKVGEENQLEANKNSLEQQVKASGFDNIDQAITYFAVESDIDAIQKEISDYETAVNTNRALIEDAKRKTEGKAFIDTTVLEDRVKELENRAKDLASKKAVVEGRKNVNINKKRLIMDILPNVEKEIKQGDIYQKLYALTSGNISGTAKVRLEQYIQSVGLDRIIYSANLRLMPISDNRFELIRHDTDGDKSQSFLDLDIIDHFSGKIKSVSDISGGESFNASLCLALGVSDMISSNAGGILDALFIDEGFATLDSESLDKCIDVLDSLTSGNKVVGIISHVDTLIQSINQQIQVTRQEDKSSRLTVQYGV